MGRIVAVSSGDLESTAPINRYALGLISGEGRNVLFIGTASGDAAGYVENIENAFSALGCQVRDLSLTVREYSEAELREAIRWADLIYVGGGDTIFMRNTWKRFGMDEVLKKVYREDTAVLMGISAGAMCWFRRGCSDSPRAENRGKAGYGWANDLLGIHSQAFCPHYEDRMEAFDSLMESAESWSLALESNTAFVECNGTILFVKSEENARVYRLTCRSKEEIPAVLLGRDGSYGQS